MGSFDCLTHLIMKMEQPNKPASIGPTIDIGEPFIADDGILTQAITSTFSDGFVCLRFVEIDDRPEPQEGTGSSDEIPTF